MPDAPRTALCASTSSGLWQTGQVRLFRIAATCGVIATIAAGAGVAVAMASDGPTVSSKDNFSMPSTAAASLSLAYGTPPTPTPTFSPAPSAAPRAPSVTPAPKTVAATPAARVIAPTSAPKVPAATVKSPAVNPAAVGSSLPLRFTTGNATRVITVVAGSTGSTTATLQAWNKAAGGGWIRYGSAVTAHIGSQGMTTAPSESKSATPIGSYTLTTSFGALSNPGTGLPYRVTNSNSWWVSDVRSAMYNTYQSCSKSACPFNTAVSEPLRAYVPVYNYAVVINYNTGPIVRGAGSAFFLHVTDGTATAGCVAIPQSRLVTLMRWLTPAAHPRILIGTG
ncbi:L,D-peptidoglycan transpeptidase YkuD, ErfK/YbiS/YcfS/YnhG family [Frankineae bacterium MT45]|nr:L,D-peptidoglycan transpeptidase YkuD, ErfK/YbiS/YcfS/YnhG family [Frankineae bacterium MT45]